MGESLMNAAASFAVLLESFFTQRLMQQRQASPHTISSYRDTFRLFLRFVKQHLNQSPSRLALEEIDAPLVVAFLDELQKQRRVSARSRNLRLTAIRSFFQYAAFEAPTHSAQIQRVLAIPCKRFTRKVIDFLTREEADCLLAAPNRQTWSGRRDHAFLLVALQTGLRLSEMTGLNHEDVTLGTGAHIRVLGKGRKERCTPLTKQTGTVLKAWLCEPARAAQQPLFPNARGGRLSAHGVHYILAKHTAVASNACPSLRKKHVTPHVLRHSMAMDLLQAGADRAVIALWLGHESVETTQMYLDANLALKEAALARTLPLRGKPTRYRPTDQLLAFLNSL
jgi:site-specific recombinase XerD